MPLPHVLYPPPGENGLKSWAFWNWQDHLEILNAFNKQLGIQLQEYVIDPIPADIKTWLQRHQYYHNDMNGLLRIQGADLQTLDFKNPEVVKQWMWTHWQEHQAVRSELGI